LPPPSVPRGWLAEIQARIDSLTARESDVMAGMVAGRLNKQIAEGLGISIKTVEQHRARVMEKLQVDSLAELVRLVVGVGWSAESKNGQ
jgi:FixJ family two-component response regulator